MEQVNNLIKRQSEAYVLFEIKQTELIKDTVYD